MDQGRGIRKANDDRHRGANPVGPHPSAIEQFLGAHPATLRFVQTPKPSRRALGRESFFAICIQFHKRERREPLRALSSRRQRSSWSDLGHAAVDEELDASDVAACVGSEEGNHFGNFVQGSRATERYFISDAVCVLFDLFFRHSQGIAVARRRDDAGTNSVDADFAIFEIRGEGARELIVILTFGPV